MNYDNQNWELITQEFLSPSSRLPHGVLATVINNAFYLAYGGKLSYAVPFNLTLSLHNETDPLIWQSFFRVFNNIRKHFLWTPLEDKVNVSISFSS